MIGVIFDRLRALLLCGIACAVVSPSASRAEFVDPHTLPILTNVLHIWQIPLEERPQPRRIQTEFLFYYHDREWSVAWGEASGQPVFLPVAGSPMVFEPGQRVRFDGIVIPEREQFVWAETKIELVGREELKPLVVPDLAHLRLNHPVLADVVCLVDKRLDDETHVTLNVQSGGAVGIAYVLKGSKPFLAEPGDFIRITGTSSLLADRNGDMRQLAVFIQNSDEVEIVGNLQTDPRFEGPIRLSRDIREDTPTNLVYIVEGVVKDHEPGKKLIIWDETGQITVLTDQTLPVRKGERVRAFGHPFMTGVHQCIRGGLYRTIPGTNVPFKVPEVLLLAEQVRDLSPPEEHRGRKVKLRALLMWADAKTPFAFVADSSGGLKVLNPRWVGLGAPKAGMIVNIEGEVTPGEFVPAITNAQLTRSGWLDLGPGTYVTLEQAMTGVEDGRWVEVRGYVRQVVETNGLVRLDLSTSSGEFTTWTPPSESLHEMAGSIIRVVGVCIATANERRQLTGIQIWSPEIKYFKIEEPKPVDPFALPLRPLSSLRQFSIERALNRRIRTTGTVVLQAPGRYVCIQDGGDGLFALSRETNQFQIGDRVEVVGFAGTEGRKFLLREATFRRTGTGTNPPVAQLSSVDAVNLNLEGLLARAQGTLLNLVRKDSELVLLVRSETSVFEARLDRTRQNRDMDDLKIGSRIALTGLYSVQSDEHGAPRGFMLNLRTPGDVEVIQLPPWWTFTRLLGALLAVAAVSGLALVWAVIIARKNRLLHHAQSALRCANDELELRVEHRTRELKDQIEAKERAHKELALTQNRLIAASRQAGMAEVATGVLHNVGNVLNSLNVSASIVAERLRNSRVELVSRCAGLLKRPPEELAHFLKDDPKGRALPDYLERLGGALEADRTLLRNEMESLAKNIDHIKVIVSMQQSHAKSIGVLEELEPKELLEDAINVNCAALERHRITIRREYDEVPSVVLDRHKVLQILINLISNAKWALNHRNENREIVVAVKRAGEGRVQVSVRDNGIGIALENLQRIFTQGFTTRKDGHGFGLHSGANAARELGGALKVFSDGPNTGAMFVLELPIIAPSPVKSVSPEPATVLART